MPSPLESAKERMKISYSTASRNQAAESSGTRVPVGVSGEAEATALGVAGRGEGLGGVAPQAATKRPRTVMRIAGTRAGFTLLLREAMGVAWPHRARRADHRGRQPGASAFCEVLGISLEVPSSVLNEQPERYDHDGQDYEIREPELVGYRQE